MILFSIDVVWREQRTASGLLGVHQGKSPTGSASTQAQGRSDATSSNSLFLTFMCSCSEKLWAVNHQGPLTSSRAEGAGAAGTGVRIGLEEAGRVHTQPSVAYNAATEASRSQKSHVIFWAIFLPGKNCVNIPVWRVAESLLCLSSGPSQRDGPTFYWQRLMVRDGILRKWKALSSHTDCW